LKKLEDGSFETCTPEFKCKDYLNDFVIYNRLGTVFRVYGMDSSMLKYQDGGMYLLVTGIKKKDVFVGNIGRVVNEELGRSFGGNISVIDVDGSTESCILFIPPEMCSNTYRISLISGVLRNCNVAVEFADWQTFLAKSRLRVDCYYDTNTMKMLSERLYNFPQQADFVWVNSVYDNVKCSQPSSVGEYMVHDAGVNGWTRRFIVDIFKNKIVPNSYVDDDEEEEFPFEEEYEE